MSATVAPSTRIVLIAMLPSASITARSLSEPDGTTTPTRSSAAKSTKGSITARWEESRRLE